MDVLIDIPLLETTLFRLSLLILLNCCETDVKIRPISFSFPIKSPLTNEVFVKSFFESLKFLNQFSISFDSSKT